MQVNLLCLCNLVAKIHSVVQSSYIGELVLMQISECFLISDVVFLTISKAIGGHIQVQEMSKWLVWFS